MNYKEKLKIKSFDKSKLPKPVLEIDSSIFSNGKAYLEIGCGSGLHPIQFCKYNSTKTLLAIEHTTEKFNKFIGRHKNHPKLVNLIPIHANAISVVSFYIPENTLEGIFLLYPNPNPKSLNQRWHAMPFMKELLSKLKDSGTITIATNEKFYYEECKEFMTEVWNLSIKTDETFKGEARTHFEKKYQESGQNCYNLIFSKS